MPRRIWTKKRKFRSFLIKILQGGPYTVRGLTISGTEGMTLSGRMTFSAFLCVSLRPSAFSALKAFYSAETAEGRRDTQRNRPFCLNFRRRRRRQTRCLLRGGEGPDQ